MKFLKTSINHILINFLNHYNAILNQASWQNLTDSSWYQKLEDDLRIDINALISNSLGLPLGNGFPMPGAKAVIHGKEFYSTSELHGRTLNIEILRDRYSHRKNRWIPINSFGNLQNVNISFDPSLERQFVSISDDVKRLIEGCYRQLYRRLLAANKQANMILIEGIFEYLEDLIWMQFVDKERFKEFSEKYWISITDTESDMFFVPRYTGQVQKIAEVLMEQQHPKNSPYDILLNLMKESCYDETISDFRGLQKMNGILGINDLNTKFDPQRRLFWYGQTVIFGEKAVGWRYIADVPPLLLCIDCDHLIAEDFKKIFDEDAIHFINALFKRNVEKYKREVSQGLNYL